MLDPGALASGLVTGLREGLEAALIVGIVCATLVRTGNQGLLRKVGLGVVAAIVVSGLGGVALFATIGGLPEPYEQMFEATAMLVAAAVVTAMLFWMRRRAGLLAGKLNRAVAEVASGGTATALVLVVFTAVIREGLETALFLVGQARAATASDGGAGALSVLIGAVVGLVVSAGIGYGVYRGSRRLDLGRFFTWTGLLLVFVAAGLVSAAMHELVEINAIGLGTATAFDLGGFLSQDAGVGIVLRSLFGYSSKPEWIVLVAWAAYLGPVLTVYLLPTLRSVAKARRAATAV